MRRIFVDSGGFFALRVREDQFHDHARSLFGQANRENWRLITTNAVVIESYALLLTRSYGGRHHAIQFLDTMNPAEPVPGSALRELPRYCDLPPPRVLSLYGNQIRYRQSPMETITVNQFHDSLREHVEKVLATHEPLKVSRHNGGAFVVIGAEDWEREQETLYVLQNSSLMAQIARSSETHALGTGRRLTPEELSEIDCF